MCGRFTLGSSPEEVRKFFQLSVTPTLAPRYNIAPSQPVAAVRRGGAGGRELTLFNWGLVPSWAREPSMGSRMINARAETVAEKPSFRAAFRQRRCLIPSDGYYEWVAAAGGKQPYYIRPRDGGLLAMAGLWEHWEGSDGSTVESCTIITKESNPLLRPIHHRMPVILAPDDFDLWLEPGKARPEELRALLASSGPADLTIFPVEKYVSRPGNEGSRCIAPLE